MEDAHASHPLSRFAGCLVTQPAALSLSTSPLARTSPGNRGLAIFCARAAKNRALSDSHSRCEAVAVPQASSEGGFRVSSLHGSRCSVQNCKPFDFVHDYKLARVSSFGQRILYICRYAALFALRRVVLSCADFGQWGLPPCPCDGPRFCVKETRSAVTGTLSTGAACSRFIRWQLGQV